MSNQLAHLEHLCPIVKKKEKLAQENTTDFNPFQLRLLRKNAKII